MSQIDRLVRICKAYVDRLDSGGSDVYFQKNLIMLILTDADIKQKLFKYWPNYSEDNENCQEIYQPRFPHTLCEEFMMLNLDKTVRILDMACGTGIAADILKDHGYTNIDGVDQAQIMLDAAQRKQLYKNVYCCCITPDEKSPIPDGSYDVLLCSAGLFPGSIDIRAFMELIRLVKIGGILAWNIDRSVGDCEAYDKIICDLVKDGIWSEVQPVKKVIVLFDDTYGFVHVMKRLK